MKKKAELTLEEQAHRTRLRDLYCGIFVVTIFVWVLQFVLGGLANLASAHLNFYFATGLTLLANALAVFVPFFVFQKVRRDPVSPVFREIPQSEHPFLQTVLGILAVSGITLGLAGLTDRFLSLLEGLGVHSTVIVPNLGNSLLQSVFYIVLSALLSSFAYEFAFRGIAVNAMKDENRLAALLVSTVAFAFSDGHLYHIVIRLAVGVLLGLFYLRVRSFWCCMALHAASRIVLDLWWWLSSKQEYAVYVNFLILLGLVFGLAAALCLFVPQKEREPDPTPNKIALKEIFTSFGIYLMVGLLAFNLLVFTFSTDSDPTDPLLQPTPEEDRIPPLQFDRDQEFEDYYDSEGQ
ncbi:MAG: CPBP family intramembrane metalloprotease [Clostridia bacterium]|nr:CPBP family intramembrane metalloprotease [Clostridia bacterium]